MVSPARCVERSLENRTRMMRAEKTRLQIGHVIDKSVGGTDDVSNLRAICSVRNEGARNLTLDRPTARKLLIRVRRATSADQLTVLRWLLEKFPTQK